MPNDQQTPLQRVCSAMVRASRPSRDPNELTAPPRGSLKERPMWRLYEDLGRAVLADLGMRPEDMETPRPWPPIPPADAEVLVPCPCQHKGTGGDCDGSCAPYPGLVRWMP